MRFVRPPIFSKKFSRMGRCALNEMANTVDGNRPWLQILVVKNTWPPLEWPYQLSLKRIQTNVNYISVHFKENTGKTRMHSSRMRTARSLTVSPYLVVSHACPPEQPRTLLEHPRTPPQPEQPCTPPGATTHAPPLTESQTGVKT